MIKEQEAAAAALGEASADCSTRPVNITEWSIVADLIVMLMLAYFIRLAKLKAMRDAAKVSWTRGLIGTLTAKGGKLVVVAAGTGKVALKINARNEIRQSSLQRPGIQRQTMRAGMVSKEIAMKDGRERIQARHTQGAARATSPNQTSPRYDATSNNDHDEHRRVTIHEVEDGDSRSAPNGTEALKSEAASSDVNINTKEESSAADCRLGAVVRVARVKGSTHKTYNEEEEAAAAAAAEFDIFSTLDADDSLHASEHSHSQETQQQQIHLERERAGRVLNSKLETAGKAAGLAAINFLATSFIPLVILVTCLSALNRAGADLIAAGYLAIFAVFSTRFRDLRLNLRIWNRCPPSRLNIELFRILPLYVYGVLACKLLYQVPYFYPYLFRGGERVTTTATAPGLESDLSHRTFFLNPEGSSLFLVILKPLPCSPRRGGRVIFKPSPC